MPGAKETKVTALSLDFTGVEDKGGSSVHVPEGDYVAKVREAYVKPNKDDPSVHHIVWVLELVKGAKTGGKIYHRTTLNPEKLWMVRNFLMNLLGKDIPKSKVKIELTKYIGKLIGVTLQDGEPYNNKIKSEVSDTFPAEKYDETASSDDDSEESDDDDAEESDDEEEELTEIDTEDI